MQLTITALEPQRRNPDLVDLYINGELHSTVAYVAVSAERLGVGAVISAQELDQLLAADECWKAKQAAFSLLATRARAKGELMERLVMKGFGAPAVESALAAVEHLGLVDDAAFAEAWVRDRLRLRPRGTMALVYELGRKHVPAAIARAAIARVMAAANVSDDELCMAAAERWTKARARTSGDHDQHRLQRRLASYLARRGYRPGAIRAAVDATLSAGPAAD